MKKPFVEMLYLGVVLVSSNCLAQVAAVSGAPAMPIDFSKHTDKFIQEAANRGVQEIELGKVALQKSKDPHVDEIASAIVKDRTAANDELMRLAAKEKVTLPATANPESDSVIGALKGKSGRDFDAAYAHHVAADYSDTISLFQSEAKSPDADLASFARSTLDVLNQHMHMAEALTQTTAGRGVKSGAANAAPH